ncbi:MAG: type II toxin-antitoxin system HicB family antitoxin [Pirellulales bacterium]|nr:type II toxin-antitoxin system HicB family antitoxin [Pirellulales bacterium]
MESLNLEFRPLPTANTSYHVIPNFQRLRRKAYRCHVSLVHEEDDSLSAIVLNLPGAGSCGNTEEEVLENLREAVLGVIESHIEAGEDIPWLGLDEYEVPEGTNTKWIIVNA